MFSIWKESLSGTVAYVGKDGINDVKVKGSFVKLVYLFLQDAEGNPSYNVIAEATELSRSIVIRCVKVLEEKGLLHKKIRPTHTVYNKSNVYSIHQPNESSSVSDTPKSFKSNNNRIRLEDDLNFSKINDAWKDCFSSELTRSQYITLTKIATVDFIVEQVGLIKEHHPCVAMIEKSGSYVYTCIQNGGFKYEKKEKAPRRQDTKRQPNRYRQPEKQVRELPKAVKNQFEKYGKPRHEKPVYSREQLEAAKAKIKQAL